MYNIVSYKHFRRVARCVGDKNNFFNLEPIKRALFLCVINFHPIPHRKPSDAYK